MLNIKPLIAAIALAFVGVASYAQTAAPATPRVDAREVKQDARIQQGVASGQLDAKETYRLEKEQAHINREQANAKTDGTVTKGERKHLNHLQNKASKVIHHQKHDAQTAVRP